jgi:hypothetical protein
MRTLLELQVPSAWLQRGRSAGVSLVLHVYRACAMQRHDAPRHRAPISKVFHFPPVLATLSGFATSAMVSAIGADG